MKDARKSSWFVAAIAVAAFAFGLLLGGGEPASTTPDAAVHETHVSAVAENRWTCSMHPQVNLPEPGACPICGMDLIPVKADGPDAGRSDRRISMSESAMRLADIETSPVVRTSPQAEIRMVGKVDFDESKLAYITAYFPGRLDRLYVDYTGVSVKKGDHLVNIYSPELLTAQEELLQAIRTSEALGSSSNKLVRNVSSGTVDAVREKLRLWGLSQTQIEKIEREGIAADDVTLYSPISGVVIHKNAVEGMYVDTGTTIYTLADLSGLWIKLDAYESDLPLLRYGEDVEFTTQALPGETFHGRISFIDPVLNSSTRTVKLRVNVDNPGARLKPGMFVRAVARPAVAAGGGAATARFAGKWISPMHPEIVKDEAGDCDICGMPMVPAEEFAAAVGEDAGVVGGELPLVIPATAPLVTGKRAVVYVRSPDEEAPVFEGREIVLGPRVGDSYIVVSGLTEGERVVTNGAFKIDSALQILAKPSMMSPDGGGAVPVHEGHGDEASRP